MKRLAAILAAALTLAACSNDREHILKVYNWSDYLEESLIEGFENWYEEQTGEKVKIVYQTFDINETMLSKIEKGQEDFDVVCPSDYIIERMLRQDMLIPIQKDFGDTPNYIDANVSPFIKGMLSALDTPGKDPNDYAVGFMWGTTGFIYNTKYVPREDVETWDVLRNPKYKGKIFVKDAARDVYSNIILYLKQDEIAAGKVTREELLTVPSKENVDLVENYLMQIKEQVAGYEADFGKDQMVLERGWISLNWSGEGHWTQVEAEKVGVSLDFVVPKEGCSLWLDGWVIPKYAKNPKAASYFINYICRPDNAILNSEFIGYSGAIATQEIIDHFQDDKFEPMDMTYFFGEGADSLRLDPILYQSKEAVEGSVMEHDWGEDSDMLISMWSRVKGSNANVMTYVIIAAIFIALVAAVVASRTNKRRHGKKNRRRR